jgi:hypothetical protein
MISRLKGREIRLENGSIQERLHGSDREMEEA